MTKDDFFVGIGDINSAFLPKQQSLTPNLPQDPTSVGVAKIPTAIIPSAPAQKYTSTPPPKATSPDLDSTAQAELDDLAKTEMIARNADALEAQLEERPLAKQQEKLQEAEDASDSEEPEKTPSANGGSENGEVSQSPSQDTSHSTTPKPEKHVRKALLKNDDRELVRVQNVSAMLPQGLTARSIIF